MRILFLYCDRPHAEPLLRSRELLLTHDMLLESHFCSDAMEAARLSSHPADAILIHHQLMSEDIAGQRKPVAILERIDGAQLESRAWLPDVAAVLKSYVARPRDVYNRYRGRIFAHRLREAGAVSDNTRALPGPPPPLATAELAKIHVVYGFGASAGMIRLAEQFVDLDSPRRILCQFRGHLDYRGTEIEWHRRKAAAAVQGLANMMPDRILCGQSILHHAYIREMWGSKTIVSPWGWGESCHRDYEAMLMGAVVVKPDSDYVEGWPDIYHNGETYVSCKPDFADLPEVVLEIDAHWDKYRPMRQRAYELALEAASTPAIAGRLVGVLRRIA